MAGSRSPLPPLYEREGVGDPAADVDGSGLVGVPGAEVGVCGALSPGDSDDDMRRRRRVNDLCSWKARSGFLTSCTTPAAEGEDADGDGDARNNGSIAAGVLLAAAAVATTVAQAHTRTHKRGPTSMYDRNRLLGSPAERTLLAPKGSPWMQRFECM